MPSEWERADPGSGPIACSPPPGTAGQALDRDPMSTVLGLDIGGSKSRARLARDHHVVAEAQASSASLTAAGQSRADAALTELLAQLPESATGLDAVCVGAAGLGGAPQTRDFLRAKLSPLTRSGAVLIVEDAALVLPAAGLTDGIAVICGTGSIAVGHAQDRHQRAGGWGYLLGDEGSGYWIVRSAVRVLLDRYLRNEPPGPLGERLLGAAGVSGLDKLHGSFLARPEPPFWARYAPDVLDSGDPAAAALTVAAASALADLAVAVATALAAPRALPVVLAGGLMDHPGLRTATTNAIAAALPGSEIRRLTEPPVAGAVRLALAAAAETSE
ncbi:MAG TPA: BadF/BadG/BcrA/BcrD ATPase family protein [Streptosporangiaceae bacterium]